MNRWPRAALVHVIEGDYTSLTGLRMQHGMTIWFNGRIHVLEGEWQRFLANTVYELIPRLRLREGVTWVTVLDSLLEDPGIDAIEALWRMGGTAQIRTMVAARWADPRFALAYDALEREKSV